MKKHLAFAGKVVVCQIVLFVVLLPISLVRWGMSEQSGQTHSAPTFFDHILEAGLYVLLAPILLLRKILPEFFWNTRGIGSFTELVLNVLLTALIALLASLCFHEHKDSKAKRERDSPESAL